VGESVHVVLVPGALGADVRVVAKKDDLDLDLDDVVECDQSLRIPPPSPVTHTISRACADGRAPWVGVQFDITLVSIGVPLDQKHTITQPLPPRPIYLPAHAAGLLRDNLSLYVLHQQ
jgi:hypothetical protein